MENPHGGTMVVEASCRCHFCALSEESFWLFVVRLAKR